MKIAKIHVGFIEIPNKIGINVFTQGCKLNCKDCSNPELQPENSIYSKEYSFVEFIDKVNEISDGFIKYISWLGGDPIEQIDLLEFIRGASIFGYKNILYTGRNFKSGELDEVRDDLDVIIDGRWEGIPITDPKSNQKIYIKNEKTNVWKNISWEELKNEKF